MEGCKILNVAKHAIAAIIMSKTLPTTTNNAALIRPERIRSAAAMPAIPPAMVPGSAEAPKPHSTRPKLGWIVAAME